MPLYGFWLIIAYMAFNFLFGSFTPNSLSQDIELFSHYVPDFNMALAWRIPIKMLFLWAFDILVLVTLTCTIFSTKSKIYKTLAVLVLLPIVVFPFLDFMSYQPNRVFTYFGQPGFFPDEGLLLRNLADGILLTVALIMGLAGSEGLFRKILIIAVIMAFSTRMFSTMVGNGVSSEFSNLRIVISLIVIVVATICNLDFVKMVVTSFYSILFFLVAVLMLGIFIYMGGSLAWNISQSIVWTVVGAILGPFIGIILLIFGLSLLKGGRSPSEVIVLIKKR
jgi:hypothetical protein